MGIVTNIIQKILAKAGYGIYKRSAVVEPGSMKAGLYRIKQIGIAPSVLIDIGAAQGTWTEKALFHWPAAKYELIEPLAEQVTILDQLKAKYPNINYHLAVAGEATGEVFLNVSSDLDGSGVYGTREGNTRKVPVITIDEIAANTKGDILIKFDTHGYEVPILKGSTEALKRVTAMVIEVYGFPISPTCLLFHELSSYLEGLGFRLFDIVDIMRRPGDNAFWQADAFYIRKDNPVFEKNSYASAVS